MENKNNHFKLFIALPVYGGNMTTATAKGLMDLCVLLYMFQVPYQYQILTNESLIQRARNTLASNFMKSDCTHLMFIDADIQFDPNDVLRMLESMSVHNIYILGGMYPRKQVHWEAIKQTVLANPTMPAEDCKRIAAPLVVNVNHIANTLDQTVNIDVNAPMEVSEIGTGFLIIHRKVFEVYKSNHPDMIYDPQNDLVSYFNVRVDLALKRLVSEDYAFCQDVRALGFKVYAAPWVHLGHVGSFVYTGSLEDIAKYKIKLA